MVTESVRKCRFFEKNVEEKVENQGNPTFYAGFSRKMLRKMLTLRKTPLAQFASNLNSVELLARGAYDQKVSGHLCYFQNCAGAVKIFVLCL